MIWGILGAFSVITGIASVGYSLYDILSTGAYKDWSIGDWLWNIAYMLLLLQPFFNVFGGFSKACMACLGGISRLLQKVPLIGYLVKYAHQSLVAFKSMLSTWGIRLFGKTGILFKFGESLASIGATIVKHPWLMFGLIFSTTMFDGLLKRIFQLWGDLSLKALSFAYERVGEVMSNKGYDDPVSQAIAVLDESRGALPPCFTAVWGAVGASECIGLIITTFHYLFILSALVKGYKVFNGK